MTQSQMAACIDTVCVLRVGGMPATFASSCAASVHGRHPGAEIWIWRRWAAGCYRGLAGLVGSIWLEYHVEGLGWARPLS